MIKGQIRLIRSLYYLVFIYYIFIFWFIKLYVISFERGNIRAHHHRRVNYRYEWDEWVKVTEIWKVRRYLQARPLHEEYPFSNIQNTIFLTNPLSRPLQTSYRFNSLLGTLDFHPMILLWIRRRCTITSKKINEKCHEMGI